MVHKQILRNTMIHSVNNTYSIDGGFVKWYINKYLVILRYMVVLLNGT